MYYYINRYLTLEENTIKLSEIEMDLGEYNKYFYEQRGNKVLLDFIDARTLQVLENFAIISKYENFYNLIPNLSYSFFNIESRCLLEDINYIEADSIGIIEIPFFQGTLKQTYSIESIDKLKFLSETIPNPNESDYRFNSSDNLKIYDYGFFKITNAEIMLKEIKSVVRKIYSTNKILPIFIGGDHTITYHILSAISDIKKDKVRLIYLDAHLDISKTELLYNGSVIQKIKEHNKKIEIINFGQKGPIFHEEDNKGIKIINKIDELIEYIKSEPQTPTYLSIDLDVFDNTFIPSVTYSVPGGLTYSDFKKILNELNQIHLNIIGVDIVEYNKDKDVGDLGAVNTLYIIYDILKFLSRKRGYND